MKKNQVELPSLPEKLRRSLNEGRYRHSLGVAECSRELAERFGCDPGKAYIAGLLHDCATGLSDSEMLSLALEAGLRTSDTVCEDPAAAYHAPLGAVVAETEYGITDPVVLQAIAYHQTGGVPMTKLDMIVSLADAIEPSRTGETIDEIRRMAQEDLVRAYTEKCRFYMMNILRSGNPLPRERVDVYNYLLTLQK